MAFSLIGILVVLLAFLIGLLIRLLSISSSGGGGGTEPDPAPSGLPEGYPYAGIMGMVGSYRAFKPSRTLITLGAAMAFLLGLTVPVYGQAVDYGVYRK